MNILQADPIWTWDHFLFGLTYATVASFIFLFIVLLLFKPKIRISPFVCKGEFNKDDKTEYYFIKIINVSLFSAYDIRAELLEVDYYPAENGQMHNRYVSLKFVQGEISHIPGYRPSWIRKNAPYAVKVRTTADLQSILTNDYKSVVVKVSLRHGLTGLAKVGYRQYSDETCIKMGKFKYGLKFGPLK